MLCVVTERETLICYFALYALLSDLWFRVGSRGGTGPVQTHDPGSGHTVLPRTGDPNGRPALFGRRRCLVGGMHIRRTVGQKNSIPGAEPGAAGRSSIIGYSIFGRHMKRSEGYYNYNALYQFQEEERMFSLYLKNTLFDLLMILDNEFVQHVLEMNSKNTVRSENNHQYNAWKRIEIDWNHSLNRSHNVER